MAPQAPETTGAKRYWRLLRRFAAASVVATAISQVVFLAVYALGAAPVAATITAWLAGAVPNFTLNRHTWGSTGRTGLRGEVLRYAVISVTTALLAALATHHAEAFAQSLTRSAQVVVVWGAFLGTYAVTFVLKFFLVDRLVFPGRR
ncbi:GtrA family protein [Saccharopolyspora sp. NPDC000359]|uniref:GtrA family protein n=1 Tax=Saccharopolyspora sp. NPDC000359 TaxID=3154251 RepID=UPI003324E5F2